MTLAAIGLVLALACVAAAQAGRACPAECTTLIDPATVDQTIACGILHPIPSEFIVCLMEANEISVQCSKCMANLVTCMVDGGSVTKCSADVTQCGKAEVTEETMRQMIIVAASVKSAQEEYGVRDVPVRISTKESFVGSWNPVASSNCPAEYRKLIDPATIEIAVMCGISQTTPVNFVTCLTKETGISTHCGQCMSDMVTCMIKEDGSLESCSVNLIDCALNQEMPLETMKRVSIAAVSISSHWKEANKFGVVSGGQPTGQCVSYDDRMTIYSPDFHERAKIRADACRNKGWCIATSFHLPPLQLSVGCASCYADWYDCSTKMCGKLCKLPESTKCRTCEINCNSSLHTCSGIFTGPPRSVIINNRH